LKRCRIIFSGSGGQGVITAARILAETAALYEGLNAVQSQSYGPEARGGACRSDVIISDTEILFPKVNQPNILVSLTQEAYNTYSNLIRPGGLLLFDTHYVQQEKKVDARQIGLAMYKAVLKEVNNPIVFNICVLGALICLVPLIEQASIDRVLESHFSPAMLSINKRAFKLGKQLAEDYTAESGILTVELW
jgi:2-oxoglutarate ferredoxin oxidoreductase subunit gamma